MYYFTALLIAIIFILIVYIVVRERSYKPVGGLLVDISEDKTSARVGVALYKDYDILEISSRKYVVLEVDNSFKLSDYGVYPEDSES